MSPKITRTTDQKILDQGFFVRNQIFDHFNGPLPKSPFRYGPWLFCHNGTIEGFDRLRPSFERETLPELAASRRGDNIKGSPPVKITSQMSGCVRM